MTTRLALSLGLVSLLGGTAPSPSAAQAPERKIAEMELRLLGVSATVEPANPVIPKNTDAGVRIVVRSGGRELSLSEAAAFFGAGFWVEGELAGFSLEKTETLSRQGRQRDDVRRQLLQDELKTEEGLLANARTALAAKQGKAGPDTAKLNESVRLHEKNIEMLRKELGNLK